jgi:hypothetical protein
MTVTFDRTYGIITTDDVRVPSSAVEMLQKGSGTTYAWLRSGRAVDLGAVDIDWLTGLLWGADQ